ncbi:anthranilate phosphoribosyltransferase 1 [Catellatospora methionotrophica]|uniref:Anthranilate phosphoribosyltransferase n=1 Tax=Catellatospora methionotrophica TaxID=121620 RepID=A0A8J3PE67_9ACTN|nr:anthranilate phosphoribosyltransferase [Catellatospora methionotrophica]GIG13053.1 anthranilate phosphoribosyltransferase 1 [Catellatospora methionotrophica]
MGDRNTWPHLLGALLRREELTPDDTAWAMGEIMSGVATPAQIAGFALLLRAKGETAGEVSGLVATMLSNAAPLPQTDEQRTATLDVVGTGGDQAHTVNISTMSAIVAAGAGARVVKHGNRAASSSCGTADVLEFLGIPLDLSPEQVSAVADEAGITFCFAATFHQGLRHASGVRRELGVPTAFNFLGPLTNPARPRAGAIGCADVRMAGVMAQVFADRGDTALVLCGEDGLDEFTTAAPTRVWVARGGRVTPLTIDAADLGVARSAAGDLRGGDVSLNADVVRRLLGGQTGPVRDAVLVNTAAGLTAHDWARQGAAHAAPDALIEELTEALHANMRRAAEAVDSGAAASVLERWVTAAAAAKYAE